MSIDNQTATFPVGDVDFNKPIQSMDGTPARVIGVLPIGEYPIIVHVEGFDLAMHVDKDGISCSTGMEGIENVPEGPKMVHGRLLKTSTGDLFFDTEVFDSEDRARTAYITGGDSLVKVVSVELPDESTEETVPSISLDGITITPGMTVRSSRRGFGVREVKVIKLRNDVRKSLFIDPQDGNPPYWALNKNIIVD